MHAASRQRIRIAAHVFPARTARGPLFPQPHERRPNTIRPVPPTAAPPRVRRHRATRKNAHSRPLGTICAAPAAPAPPAAPAAPANDRQSTRPRSEIRSSETQAARRPPRTTRRTPTAPPAQPNRHPALPTLARTARTNRPRQTLPGWLKTGRAEVHLRQHRRLERRPTPAPTPIHPAHRRAIARSGRRRAEHPAGPAGRLRLRPRRAP